jgi:hypothetical protein
MHLTPVKASQVTGRTLQKLVCPGDQAMARRTTRKPIEAEDGPTLTISLETVCWVILKAREFDVKDGPSEADGSNASDDNMVSVLEDRSDDPVEEELTSLLSSLSADEQIDLVALMWLGRDDSALSDWPEVRAEAERAHANHPTSTATYLLGEPLLSDFLEEGLAKFGLSCDVGGRP